MQVSPNWARIALSGHDASCVCSERLGHTPPPIPTVKRPNGRRIRGESRVGAEVPVTSCGLHVLVDEAAESVSS